MRPITQSPAPSPSSLPPQPNLVVPLAGAATTAFSLLLFLLVCFRKITRNRTAPEADSKPPHRYSYSLLRRATDSFSPTRRLGQGGSGSVFLGTLPHTGKDVAVKLMDSGSLQSEREFQNELFFAPMLDSEHVISVLGFSSDRKRRRMLLVYEFMGNGNLQDALLRQKCPELMEWKKRFSIMVDIAKGLSYLHGLDPPVVHGDVKPSNVLLDRCFNVKIADFGLARLKSEIHVAVGEDVKKEKSDGVEEYGSVVEETESVCASLSVTTAGFEESNLGADQSPVPVSPETAATASPEENVDKEGGEKMSVNKDWWMRQENGSYVKDYVMEWIGNEIGNEMPTAAASSSEMLGKGEKKKSKKRKGKRLEWWMSMEESGKVSSKEKRRPAREWWKEEYCDELTKKKKKKDKKHSKGMSFDENESDWWPHDDELYAESKKRKKRRSRSWGSMSSIDWWLDGMRRNASNNSVSGEIPKSCGMSSTPSMRGTLCYVAPEYGFGGDPSELCDVYSFGVVLLVIIAGRRPLQVTNSPLSEFQRANLLSWARHLARAGKLIDLVDKSIQGLDREQALLCITVALVCLQKIPARRPSMKEVVGMLTGKLEPPKLPPELTTSAQSRFLHKSHKKVRFTLLFGSGPYFLA
ncbi:hypothetical protein ACLB2K_071168 [Fragaria x ananassa]